MTTARRVDDRRGVVVSGGSGRRRLSRDVISGDVIAMAAAVADAGSVVTSSPVTSSQWRPRRPTAHAQS